MRKALIYILLIVTSVTLSAQGTVIPVKGAFLKQLQERDSVLVADQLLYGFRLDGVAEGTQLMLPELPEKQDMRMMFLTPWVMDTLKVTKSKDGQLALLDVTGSVLITSFEEGLYDLPQIAVQRMSSDGVLDTLVFDPVRLEVKTMPVDTATFQPHDIKGQIRYPVTVDEVIPWLGLFWLVAVIIILTVCLLMMRKRKNDPEYVRKDPAHIVALRELDKFRGSQMWAPEKQKDFYSGVTDALREYISERYGIGAMEMTTAEIFDQMKGTDVPEKLQKDTKELFDRADFVKFAKYVASEDENAATLPLAVRFVTETYQAEIVAEEEKEEGGAE
ncbi:MAG: hypothetical protein IIX08_09245 [Bacteroidales bacterium]|nr:hypothetical protein [Bacteroidales bacterium]